MLNEYFPRRTTAVLNQFRALGLYPKADAPGGERAGAGVILRTTAGTIYFTQDGSDPRLAGGRVSPRAVKYTSPIPGTTNQRIKARALVGPTDAAEWSALAEF